VTAGQAYVTTMIDDIMSSAYSVSLMGRYGGPTIQQLWCKVRLGDQEDPAPVPGSLYGGSWYDDADLPEGHNLNVRGSIPGPWSERLSHFRLDSAPSAGGDELQSEWFVDRAHAAAALTELRALGDRIDPHLHATEIRTCAADELWLSPAYRRQSVCFGFTWRNHPDEVAALVPVVEQALAPFQPRAHWGKLFAMDGAELTARYPRAAEFRDLTRRYDPTGKFWNPFLSAVFDQSDGLLRGRGGGAVFASRKRRCEHRPPPDSNDRMGDSVGCCAAPAIMKNSVKAFRSHCGPPERRQVDVVQCPDRPAPLNCRR
jgi:xylitol oxidase